MLGRLCLVGAVLTCSVGTGADYVAERDAATRLVKAKKHAAAMAAFTRMAQGKASDVQRSDALEQAALCAQCTNKPDQAMALARQIPLAPWSKTVQMGIMHANQQRRELIARFRDEAIGAWPEKHAGRAFYYRGEAYLRLKDGKAAEADLKRAVDDLADGQMRGQALLALAHNCRSNLKDENRALEIYVQAQSAERKRARWGWMYFTSVNAAAGILRKQRRYGEALDSLAQVDVRQMRDGYWRAVMLCAHGDILAAQGKREEALATFGEAAKVQRIRDWQKAGIHARIKAVRGDAR